MKRPLYAALDLHSAYSVLGSMDHSGKTQPRMRFATEAERLRAQVSALKQKRQAGASDDGGGSAHAMGQWDRSPPSSHYQFQVNGITYDGWIEDELSEGEEILIRYNSSDPKFNHAQDDHAIFYDETRGYAIPFDHCPRCAHVVD